VIRGDSLSLSIAAASIIAKVTRDRMMARLGPHHPHYGLERHMGYGSKAHREAIGSHGGVRRVHRFTFAPLK
jgi:ribonuclease HII